MKTYILREGESVTVEEPGFYKVTAINKTEKPLLQAVTDARAQRAEAEYQFRAALVRAKEAHSWAEVARAAGVSKSGARWLVRAAENAHE